MHQGTGAALGARETMSFFIRTGDSGTKRIAAIAGLMLILTMTFSVFYIAEEAGHHCEDEDCPICMCIQLCRNIIQSGGSGSTGLEWSPFLLILPVIIFTAYFTIDTPVSKRIRLNN
jgi:hypothetical protein